MTFKKDKLRVLSDCNQRFEVRYKPLKDGENLLDINWTDMMTLKQPNSIRFIGLSLVYITVHMLLRKSSCVLHVQLKRVSKRLLFVMW